MEKYGISFKEMSKKQKVKHIWTYYRYHILASIIAVVVISMIGKTIFFPAPDNSVDIMVCGQMYLGKEQEQEIKSFKDKYNTGLGLTPLSWKDDSETAGVMMQKIPLMITVKSLEILALPEEQYENFVKLYGDNMFTPLDEVPELADTLDKYKDHLYTCNKKMDEEGNEVDAPEHVYGIKVDQLPGIKSIEQCSEMVIGLTGTIRDENKAYCMFKYILGDEEAIGHFFDNDHKDEKETSK